MRGVEVINVSRKRLRGSVIRAFNWFLFLLATGLLISVSNVSADRRSGVGDAVVIGAQASSFTRSSWYGEAREEEEDFPSPNASELEELFVGEIGSFEVRRPQGEEFIRGMRSRLVSSSSSVLSEAAILDELRYRARVRLTDEQEASSWGEWLLAKRDELRWGMLLSGADYATDYALAALESEASGLSFIRNVEVDYRSSLGDRRWSAGLSALGAFRESESGMLGWELRGFASEGSSGGANAGLIYRRLLSGSSLLGANVFLDYESHGTYNADFWRWSFGGEYRSSWLDLHANRYIGLTGGKYSVSGGVKYVTYTRDGYDILAELHSPSHDWLSGFLSYYNWSGEYGESDDKGWRYGLNFRPTGAGFLGNVLEVELEVSDSAGGASHLGGKLTYSYRFNEGKDGGYVASSSGYDSRSDLYSPVRREYAQRISRVRVSPSLPLLTDGNAAIAGMVAGDRLLVQGESLNVTVSASGYSGVSNGATVTGTTVTLRSSSGAELSTSYSFTVGGSLTLSVSSGSGISIRSGSWTLSLGVSSSFSFPSSSVIKHISGTIALQRRGGLSVVEASETRLTLLGTELTISGEGAVLVEGTVALSVTSSIHYPLTVRGGVMRVSDVSSGVIDREIGCLKPSQRSPTSSIQYGGTDCEDDRGSLRSVAGGTTLEVSSQGEKLTIWSSSDGSTIHSPVVNSAGMAVATVTWPFREYPFHKESRIMMGSTSTVELQFSLTSQASLHSVTITTGASYQCGSSGCNIASLSLTLLGLQANLPERTSDVVATLSVSGGGSSSYTVSLRSGAGVFALNDSAPYVLSVTAVTLTSGMQVTAEIVIDDVIGDGSDGAVAVTSAVTVSITPITPLVLSTLGWQSNFLERTTGVVGTLTASGGRGSGYQLSLLGDASVFSVFALSDSAPYVLQVTSSVLVLGSAPYATVVLDDGLGGAVAVTSTFRVNIVPSLSLSLTGESTVLLEGTSGYVVATVSASGGLPVGGNSQPSYQLSFLSGGDVFGLVSVLGGQNFYVLSVTVTTLSSGSLVTATLKLDDGNALSPAVTGAITVSVVSSLSLSFKSANTVLVQQTSGYVATLSLSGGTGSDYSVSILLGSNVFGFGDSNNPYVLSVTVATLLGGESAIALVMFNDGSDVTPAVTGAITVNISAAPTLVLSHSGLQAELPERTTGVIGTLSPSGGAQGAVHSLSLVGNVSVFALSDSAPYVLRVTSNQLLAGSLYTATVELDDGAGGADAVTLRATVSIVSSLSVSFRGVETALLAETPGYVATVSLSGGLKSGGASPSYQLSFLSGGDKFGLLSLKANLYQLEVIVGSLPSGSLATATLKLDDGDALSPAVTGTITVSVVSSLTLSFESVNTVLSERTSGYVATVSLSGGTGSGYSVSLLSGGDVFGLASLSVNLYELSVTVKTLSGASVVVTAVVKLDDAVATTPAVTGTLAVSISVVPPLAVAVTGKVDALPGNTRGYVATVSVSGGRGSGYSVSLLSGGGVFGFGDSQNPYALSLTVNTVTSGAIYTVTVQVGDNIGGLDTVSAAITVSILDPNTFTAIYAIGGVTSFQGQGDPGEVLRSTDGGVNWKVVRPRDSSQSNLVENREGVAYYQNKLWVLNSLGLQSSSDGRTWNVTTSLSGVGTNGRLFVLNSLLYALKTDTREVYGFISGSLTLMATIGKGASGLNLAGADVVVAGDRAYVMGGFASSVVWSSADGWAWTDAGRMPSYLSNRYIGGGVFVFDNSLYLMGGYDTSSKSDIYRSGLVSVAFTRVGDLPVLAADHQVISVRLQNGTSGMLFVGSGGNAPKLWSSLDKGITWAEMATFREGMSVSSPLRNNARFRLLQALPHDSSIPPPPTTLPPRPLLSLSFGGTPKTLVARNMEDTVTTLSVSGGSGSYQVSLLSDTYWFTLSATQPHILKVKNRPFSSLTASITAKVVVSDSVFPALPVTGAITVGFLPPANDLTLSVVGERPVIQQGMASYVAEVSASGPGLQPDSATYSYTLLPSQNNIFNINANTVSLTATTMTAGATATATVVASLDPGQGTYTPATLEITVRILGSSLAFGGAAGGQSLLTVGNLPRNVMPLLVYGVASIPEGIPPYQFSLGVDPSSLQSKFTLDQIGGKVLLVKALLPSEEDVTVVIKATDNLGGAGSPGLPTLSSLNRSATLSLKLQFTVGLLLSPAGRENDIQMLSREAGTTISQLSQLVDARGAVGTSSNTVSYSLLNTVITPATNVSASLGINTTSGLITVKADINFTVKSTVILVARASVTTHAGNLSALTISLTNVFYPNDSSNKYSYTNFHKKYDFHEAGMSVYATKNVPVSKMAHAIKMLRGFLIDSGTDQMDATVSSYLSTAYFTNRALFMFADENERAKIAFTDGFQNIFYGGYTITPQDLLADEVNENYNPTLNAPQAIDATFEEVLHLITDGLLVNSHPQIYKGMASSLAVAMTAARKTASPSIPKVYPPGAWYTYYDASCNVDCLMSEYFYWGAASRFNAHNNNFRFDQIRGEWRIKNSTELQKTDKALYDIVGSGVSGGGGVILNPYVNRHPETLDDIAKKIVIHQSPAAF